MSLVRNIGIPIICIPNILAAPHIFGAIFKKKIYMQNLELNKIIRPTNKPIAYIYISNKALIVRMQYCLSQILRKLYTESEVKYKTAR